MSERRTLLVEIGTEDLPPGMVVNGFAPFVNELSFRLVREKFLKQEPASLLPFFWTSRRIAARIPDVATHQPTQTEERQGPPATKFSEDDPKVRGFARDCGIEVNQLEIRDGRLFGKAQTSGRALGEYLPKLLPAALHQIPVPRRMRWGAGEHAFARPVRWLCILHGGEVIDCELFGVRSGHVTYGHRHHCPQPLELKSADEYERTLKDKGSVIVDFYDRVKQLEKFVGAHPATDLVNETAATTEWPQALTGSFDQIFLSLPDEVITQTLQHALKVFPQRDEKEKLQPEFTIVADVASADPQAIIRGYENVVRARLADAQFFFEQDKKTSLEDRRAMLKRTLFREKLGTLADKAERLEKLAVFLAPHCGALPEHVKRAAQLCKCDLNTGMVGEYPELQGIMGGYYAAAAGEDEQVAAAIREHYLPRGRDDMPKTPAGIALALADKADTLAGFWSVGLTPSGSKDPYGLRRAANGILRILIQHGIDFDIKTLVDEAASSYDGDLNQQDIHDYMREQLCSHVFVMSFPHHADKTYDRINAVVNVVKEMENLHPIDFFNRLDAIDSFVKKNPAADSLIAANKRIRNILKKTEISNDAPVADAMTESAERALLDAWNAERQAFERQFDKQDYCGAMETLAKLREPIDRFFDEVLVMSDNTAERNNRLALLQEIRKMFWRIADFSELNLNKPDKTQ